MNGKSEIEVLVPERLTYWCELIDIPPGAILALQGTAAKVINSADLTAVFEAYHDKTVVRGEWHREWSPLPTDPLVERHLGDDSSLFYLLAYLSALPHAWRTYQRLGIGVDIFQATMLDYRFYIQDYFEDHGRWGFANFGWIWRHTTAELFRLGRLQYMLMPFPGGVRAFRRKGESTAAEKNPLRSPMLLADPDMPLREDGYAWGAGRPAASDIPAEDLSTWRPSFEVTESGWHGHPIAPNGIVAKNPVALSNAEWETVLQPGDMILDLHIPRKDVFDTQTCDASYAQALEFFGRVFPDRPHKALFCHTWIFSPQLPHMLPPTSNLVRFQREFLLYPHPGTVAYLRTFVFGGEEDLRKGARDTVLRRVVLDWLENGGEIFDLAGLKFYSAGE